jgi:hypothetical protein
MRSFAVSIDLAQEQWTGSPLRVVEEGADAGCTQRRDETPSEHRGAVTGLGLGTETRREEAKEDGFAPLSSSFLAQLNSNRILIEYKFHLAAVKAMTYLIASFTSSSSSLPRQVKENQRRLEMGKKVLARLKEGQVKVDAQLSFTRVDVAKVLPPPPPDGDGDGLSLGAKSSGVAGRKVSFPLEGATAHEARLGSPDRLPKGPSHRSEDLLARVPPPLNERERESALFADDSKLPRRAAAAFFVRGNEEKEDSSGHVEPATAKRRAQSASAASSRQPQSKWTVEDSHPLHFFGNAAKAIVVPIAVPIAVPASSSKYNNFQQVLFLPSSFLLPQLLFLYFPS